MERTKCCPTATDAAANGFYYIVNRLRINISLNRFRSLVQKTGCEQCTQTDTRRDGLMYCCKLAQTAAAAAE